LRLEIARAWDIPRTRATFAKTSVRSSSSISRGRIFTLAEAFRRAKCVARFSKDFCPASVTTSSGIKISMSSAVRIEMSSGLLAAAQKYTQHTASTTLTFRFVFVASEPGSTTEIVHRCGSEHANTLLTRENTT